LIKYRAKNDLTGAFMDETISPGIAQPPCLVEQFGRKPGTAALLLVGMAASLLNAAGLGVGGSAWDASSVSLRRSVDIAANAGTMIYARTGDARAAAIAADQVAQLNGIGNGTVSHWNAASKTLSDGALTVQVVNGVRDVNDVVVKVTVGQARTAVLRGPDGTPTQATVVASAGSPAIAGGV
jgi:hypothetical protein